MQEEEFNEVEEGDSDNAIIRTLIQFTLTNANGDIVSIDCLNDEDNKQEITATGTLLLPLSNQIKEQIIGCLCASNVIADYNNNLSNDDDDEDLDLNQLEDIIDNRYFSFIIRHFID